MSIENDKNLQQEYKQMDTHQGSNEGAKSGDITLPSSIPPSEEAAPTLIDDDATDYDNIIPIKNHFADVDKMVAPTKEWEIEFDRALERGGSPYVFVWQNGNTNWDGVRAFIKNLVASIEEKAEQRGKERAEKAHRHEIVALSEEIDFTAEFWYRKGKEEGRKEGKEDALKFMDATIRADELREEGRAALKEELRAKIEEKITTVPEGYPNDVKVIFEARNNTYSNVLDLLQDKE